MKLVLLPNKAWFIILNSFNLFVHNQMYSCYDQNLSLKNISEDLLYYYIYYIYYKNMIEELPLFIINQEFQTKRKSKAQR